MTHVSNLWKLTVKHHRYYQKECTINKSLRLLAAIKAGQGPRSASINAAQTGLPAHSGLALALARQQSWSPRCSRLYWENKTVPNSWTPPVLTSPIPYQCRQPTLPNYCAASPSSISRKTPSTICTTALSFLQTRTGSLPFLAVL